MASAQLCYPKHLRMMTIISPILNLLNKTGEESIKLGDDFLVRQATPSEVRDFRSMYQGGFMLADFRRDYTETIHILESSFDAKSLKTYVPFDKFEGSDGQYREWMRKNEDVCRIARETLENKLTFLRLMKAGQIACNIFALKEKTREGERTGAVQVRYYVPWHYKNYPYEFELLSGDIDRFTSDYQLFGSKISIADYPSLRYFFKGYHEPLLQDRVLDIVIALESLYLSNEPEKTTFRYKLAMRCAAYIGEDYEEREKVRRTVLRAYDLRSGIVHGGKETKKKKATRQEAETELEQIFPTIEGYLRTSLVEALREPNWPEASYFDQLLLQYITPTGRKEKGFTDPHGREAP